MVFLLCGSYLWICILQACTRRIEGDESGTKHCTGQYFDYWHCIDKCVSYISQLTLVGLFSIFFVFFLGWGVGVVTFFCSLFSNLFVELLHRLPQSYLKNSSNKDIGCWSTAILSCFFRCWSLCCRLAISSINLVAAWKFLCYAHLKKWLIKVPVG